MESRNDRTAIDIAAELKKQLEIGVEPMEGAAQHNLDIIGWTKFITTFKPKSIIELGTGSGAFYQFLRKWIPWGRTIDNKDTSDFIDDFINLDIFSKQDTIKELIETAPKPLVLFCDNGNKPREVKEYSKYLSDNDFLVVHDFEIEIRAEDIPEEFELLEISGLTAFFKNKQQKSKE